MLAISDDAWSTSSRSSGAHNCVEVAHGPGWAAVRDSKNRTGPVLVFTADEWDTFLKSTVASSAHSPIA